MKDESQTPKRFLNFFPQDVANLILARLPLNDVKSVSRVARGDHACTTYFIATAMARFWRPESLKMTDPVTLKYHYSCAEYYSACSDARKSKALMRFFSMLMLDLMANYGKRLNQCVTFNREELPERLVLTCKNQHLLLDVSEYLLEKFNFSLEFHDTNDTTHAVITHEQVERHCATMLFQYVVYDFLKTADLIKILTRFLDTQLFATELKIVDKNGWESFRTGVFAYDGAHVQLCTSQSIDTLRTFLLNKLHYLADDSPNLPRVQRDGFTIVDIEMRHLETQPGFFTAALKLIQPLIKIIMLENIPPDAVEKALETEFAAYEKPVTESKTEKCSVM